MPRVASTSASSTKLRRSSRLSDTSPDAEDLVLRNGKRAQRVVTTEHVQPSPKRRYVQNQPIAAPAPINPPTEQSKKAWKQPHQLYRSTSPKSMRESMQQQQAASPTVSKWSPADMYHKLILRKAEVEESHARRLEEVAARERDLENARMEAERTKARELLAHLDDTYTCSLCYDIVAHPVSFVPHACGHSFCGGCLTKAFLARLHDCAHWHEELECPICRAAHYGGCGYTDTCIEEAYPCVHVGYPTVPNRLAAHAIEDLIERLSTAVAALGDGVDEDLARWGTNGEAPREWKSRTASSLRDTNDFEHAWYRRDNMLLLDIKRRLGL